MCATNVWAVNAAAFTPEFRLFTAERIGVEPQAVELLIASSRIRASSVAFTLTLNMCDCRTLIGRRHDDPAADEASAEAWLGWLRDLPERVPHLSRIAILRAWSPQGAAVTPVRTRGVRINEVTEETLRDVRDDMLLTVDYPRVA